ncbi:uncharacterized protein ACBT44_021278 isoform 2-T3 [Syngnathus typhle]
MAWCWRPCLCFIVFLCLIPISKEDCKDYFDIEEWKNHSDEMVSLVITENITDVAECTLERYKMTGVMQDCFDRDPTSQSAKCDPVRIVTVHTHYLMCLVAKVKNFETGCEYADVCSLIEERCQAVTAPATSTVGSCSTAQLSNSYVSSPKCIPVAGNGQDAQNISCQSKELFYLKALFGISSTLAIALPFAVYFYMQRKLRAKQRKYDNQSSKSDLLMENVGESAS